MRNFNQNQLRSRYDFLKAVDVVKSAPGRNLNFFKDEVESKGIPVRFPEVYNAISQMPAYENLVIPAETITQEDKDALKTFTSSFLKTVFPGCQIRENADSVVLKLNSSYCKAIFSIGELIQKNVGWNNFIFEKFSIPYQKTETFMSFFVELSKYKDLNQGQNKIVHEYDSNENMIVRISTKWEDYSIHDRNHSGPNRDALEASLSKGWYKSFRTPFHFLIFLQEMAGYINFIGDYYKIIFDAVNQELEKTKNEFEQTRLTSVPKFKNVLASRKVSIEDNIPEEIKIIMNEMGITEFIQPFNNNYPITKETDIGFGLFFKENFKGNQDWILIPPTEREVSLEGYVHQGNFVLTEFNPEHFLSVNGEAPHLLKTRCAKLDTDIFNTIISENYPEEFSLLAQGLAIEAKLKETNPESDLIQNLEPKIIASEIEETILSEFDELFSDVVVESEASNDGSGPEVRRARTATSVTPQAPAAPTPVVTASPIRVTFSTGSFEILLRNSSTNEILHRKTISQENDTASMQLSSFISIEARTFYLAENYVAPENYIIPIFEDETGNVISQIRF